jgi:hypothetical protein
LNLSLTANSSWWVLTTDFERKAKICLTKKENDDEEENFHNNILPGRSL